MNVKEIVSSKLTMLNEENIIKYDVPLKDYCSFKIGGPAEVFCVPKTQAQLIELMAFCLRENISYFILGKGSNLLISDQGLTGMVISTSALNKITKDENYISAFSGVLLKDLCEFAQEHGLSGLEFAHGIPGSVGGAVYMNAGAYGGEIKDVLYCSKCLSPQLSLLESTNPIIHLKAADHCFAYRSSALQVQGLIHLSSVFKLKQQNPAEILAKMDDFKLQRWDKQPMDLPSAGSVFKRPEGYFTGKLIDDCGLRGYRIGDAAVSNKHCGFIVNLGNATAKDVLQLIRYVQQTVYSRFQVKLETEIRVLGVESK
ncbi:MAG: UDP-N-acetylmuramate dehydrogenase [Candidatus Cloacimonetes bacterium]|nr:UDP-N-acetylmuramate dehydrogenase [Candidatus Cloacimonadota bacterium]